MLVKLMKEIANELFAKEEGLQYIIFYLAETYKLYLQGNIVLSKEAEEYLKENKIPIMYELNMNKRQRMGEFTLSLSQDTHLLISERFSAGL